MRKALSIFSFVIGALCLSACNGFSKEVAQSSTCAAAERAVAKAAFESTIYTPYLRPASSCVRCHVPGGKGPTPFAMADTNGAYSAGLGKLILNDPRDTSANSIAYGVNEHDGSGPTAASQNASAFLAAVEAWAELENAVIDAKAECESRINDPNTTPTPDPTPAPVNKAYKTVGNITVATAMTGVAETDLATARTINLSMNSVDAIAQGATFQVKLKRSTVRDSSSASAVAAAPGAFLFYEPRLISPTRALRVQDFRITISAGAKKTTLDIYNSVNQIVAVNTTGVQLSTSADFLVRPDDLSAETIKVEVLEVGSGNTTCTNLPNFVSLVKPTMTATCFACHGGGVAAAAAAFSMNAANDAATCSSLKQRMSNPAAQSMAILYPGTRTYPTKANQHPVVTFAPAERANFVNWYNSEN